MTGRSFFCFLREFRLCRIEGMEQFMRLMAVGFLQEFRIQLLDRRIFMGFTNLLIRIFAIQSLSPFHTGIQHTANLSGNNGLAA